MSVERHFASSGHVGFVGGNMGSEFRAADGSVDSIAYGRLLLDLGVALIQGRLRLVDGFAVQDAPRHVVHEGTNGSTEDSAAALIDRFPVGVPPAIEGRPGARGRFTARKGYHVTPPKRGKVDLSGLTPQGVRLYEYLTQRPGVSAPQIADDLGLSKKTVENLLSILRQRTLIESGELKR
jgi:hypothetical protein